MGAAPSEISSSNIIQRVIRDNALAALMVVATIAGLINGVIIGAGIAMMVNNGAKVDRLQRQYEINAAWQARMVGTIQAAGIKVPPQPIEE